MADSKVTGLTELVTPPADDDMIYLADVSDTTMASSGTSKKNKAKHYIRSNGTANTLGAGIDANGYNFTGAGTVAATAVRAATYYGGTASGGTATISSTTHATKGKILFGAASAYDEANTRLGVGVTTPTAILDVSDRSVFRSGGNGSGGIWFASSDGTQRTFAGLHTDSATPVFGVFNNGWRFTVDSSGYCQFSYMGEAWANVSFNTGWANFGGSYQTAQYKKVGDLVFLRGLIKRSSGSATTILTLPSGYRPPLQVLFIIDATSDRGRVDVQSDGQVVFQEGSPVGYVQLDGIVFSTV